MSPPPLVRISLSLGMFALCLWGIMALISPAIPETSNPPYTIEIRHVAEDGSISYELQNHAEWNHHETIAGLRVHTRDVIFHSIYADGLQYCFSKSGKVYAMAAGEEGYPSSFDKEWAWPGEPRQFPHFDYSKVSPYRKP
jgi:hypothetical protein